MVIHNGLEIRPTHSGKRHFINLFVELWSFTRPEAWKRAWL